MGLTQRNIENWLKGESDELRKLINFGFYKTKAIRDKDKVVFVYDSNEINEFEKALEKYLDEEFFDRLCSRFFELIELSKTYDKNTIEIECMPIATIFDEISKYPEWATESMLRRLIRIRNCHHEFFYKLNSQCKPKE